VSQNTFYVWKRKYSGLETDDVKRLRELERENEQLTILLAERDQRLQPSRRYSEKTPGRSDWALSRI
jgi:putative transposase